MTGLWFGINASRLSGDAQVRDRKHRPGERVCLRPDQTVGFQARSWTPPAQVAALYCLIDSRESDPTPLGLLPVYCRL